MTKPPRSHALTLDCIVGGGQTLGTLDDGRKAFVWGGLPGERVIIRETKRKSRYVEGIVTDILHASSERIAPRDPASYLSTSPWQIMTFAAEQHYKAALIEEAFELHDIVLPNSIDVFSDHIEYGYRNKVEFSWYGDSGPHGETLDLAFFQRGGRGKIVVDSCSLLADPIMQLARTIRDLLRRKSVTARSLKTLLIRCDQKGNCVWQLYVKDRDFCAIDNHTASSLGAQGGEIIYSDPRSPASRITERLAAYGNPVLNDTVLGVPFHYATEGFFQVNIPVYEQALKDMRHFVSGEYELQNMHHAGQGTTQPDAPGPLRGSDDETASTRAASDNRQSSGYSAFPAEVGQGEWQLAVRPHTRGLMGEDGGEAETPARAASEQPSHPEGSAFPAERGQEDGNWRPRVPEGGDGREEGRGNEADPSRAASDNHDTDEHSAFPASVGQDKLVVGDRPYTRGLMGGGGGEAETPARAASDNNSKVLDLYAGVGSIGLTIGGDNCTLIEIDENAVREMKRNIAQLNSNANAILAPAEHATDFITSDATIIVDPPRAGLHTGIVARLLQQRPPRIIYLSCNPVTQARDIASLAPAYGIRHHRGYNFFPRTPHIEHLVVLEKRPS
ncbi:hypothetical protein CR983_03285 [Candidatus Saccharibacteria bacterium]|nr:MAG: hypothetical protein CR983_03285 [Candidatus Saccharibacteria bacterium]